MGSTGWRLEVRSEGMSSSLFLLLEVSFYQSPKQLRGCSSTRQHFPLQFQLLPCSSFYDSSSCHVGTLSCFQIPLGNQLCCPSNSPSSKFPAPVEGTLTLGSGNISSFYSPSSPSNGSSFLYLIASGLSPFSLLFCQF